MHTFSGDPVDAPTYVDDSKKNQEVILEDVGNNSTYVIKNTFGIMEFRVRK